MYEDLDTILSRRAVPEAPHGLAERIIAASLRIEARKPITLQGLWQSFADMFVLPQPAFALGMVLLIGLTMGLNGQAQSLMADDGDVVTVFALADDSYEDGASL